MSELGSYLKMFARFPFALRRFAKRTLTPEAARAIVRQRMETRPQRFLSFVERNVYQNPRSPYLAVLRHARVELGDIHKLVGTDGVEGTLAKLRAAGVYVRFEEFKGRTPIVRDGLELPVTARDFDNPHARRDFTVRTGGSTGLPTLVGQDLDHIAGKAPIQMLALDAHGLVGAPLIAWMNMLPGTGFRFLLERAHIGQWADHWFSSIGWREHREWPRFTAATCYMVVAARAAGLRIPFPEHLRPTESVVAARWLSETLARGGRAVVLCNVSLAVRICIAAREAGLDVSGATFRVGGEPVTEGKASVIRSAGGRIIAGYGMVEVSNTAIGCPNATDPGDLHVSMDTMALVTHPHPIDDAGTTVPAFHLTTLSDTVGKLMLNVQVDDCGTVASRRCGCVFEECGLDIHVSDIRSYTKLVGEGVTLIGNEMVRILEEVLPARFGGSAIDYQILEEEDEERITRIYLVIHPRIHIGNESQVLDVLHSALADSSTAAGAASLLWRQANTLRIRRAAPTWTTRGKLMPLHVDKFAAR